jgi:hypothetical protein
VENSAAHIPKAALHALAVISAKPALRPLRSAGQMGRAKLVKCQHRGQSSPAVYSVPPLLEGAKTVSFSEQALVSLLGCPDAASWSGERRIRFELGVLSVADTWNPSDDERNAARDFCAPQGPLTDMRIPDEYEAANPDTAIKVWKLRIEPDEPGTISVLPTTFGG